MDKQQNPSIIYIPYILIRRICIEKYLSKTRQDKIALFFHT